ncbi:MAG TPA: DUF4367 domain-containing protein [Desulfitobacterium dehalogenans]|uniref:DUF4367 domain-containing protein n=1 Tax=Desulfitobacterium dehalogenans TaxID=36854 RepID=A0A7C6Z4F1_9FIRM|nr:DUF4367 domain-containing protein [Desulfitobacterium dehalogenans]
MSEQESAKILAKEKMLEALLEYAAACHVENINSEYPLEDDSSSEVTLPPDFDQKMQKLIAKHDRKETLTRIKERTIRFLPKAAVFLLVLLGSFTIVVASVQALRVKALNIILDIQNQYTSVQSTDKHKGQANQGHKQIPPDWQGYAPSYVPQGFNVDKTEKREHLEIIYYSNEQGQTIRFTRYLNSNTDVRIDTEGAVLQNILIHDRDALLAEKQGLVSIVWEDDSLFSIIGEADRAELITMAESVKEKWMTE